MPSIVHVKILAARDLPVMDRTSDLTDAFAEVEITMYLLQSFEHA